MEVVSITAISEISSSQTLQILEDWSDTHVSALTHIGLEYANFSDDETCQVLADLIDAASNVSFLNIGYQNADRPIRVAVVQGTWGQANGSITITNYCTGEQILTQATARPYPVTVAYGTVGPCPS